MFGELIVAYLFLGGTGAGACAVLAALGLLADRDDVARGMRERFRDGRGAVYRRLFVPGLTAALSALALGVLCLAADLGRLDRILVLAAAAPTHYLVVGFWAIAASMVLGAASLLAWQGVLPLGRPVFAGLHGALLLAAVVTAAYTGLLLGGLRAVPLWFGPWLPLLFVLSALSCGTALVVATAALSGAASSFGRVVCGLARADCGLIALEAAALALWLAATWAAAGEMASSTGFPAAPSTPTDVAALASVTALVEGPWAPAFWGGLVFGGLAVPFAVESALVRRHTAAAAASDGPRFRARLFGSAACVLAGGAWLRYLAVAAAVQPIVSSAPVAL